MFDQEILQNLARSSRLASQTHSRALTHALLNKALLCSLVQDSNVSSNSDSRPPEDTTTARYDQFRQQSHVYCCESKNGMSKSPGRDDHCAMNRGLQEKICCRGSNAPQTEYLQEKICCRGSNAPQTEYLQQKICCCGSNAPQTEYLQQKICCHGSNCLRTEHLRDIGDTIESNHQSPIDKKLYRRCLVSSKDSRCFQRDSHLEGAGSGDDDDACQPRVQRSTRIQYQTTPGLGYARETGGFPGDDQNDQQPITGSNVSSEDKPYSYREKVVRSPREHVCSAGYQRLGENQANSSDCQQYGRFNCLQLTPQNGQDLTTQGGKAQKHEGSYLQTMNGNDGNLRQSELETNRRTEPRSQASNELGYRRNTESKMYRRTNEGELFMSSHGDQQYKRSEDQLNQEAETWMCQRSEGTKYSRTEDQGYRKPREDLQYKQQEGQKFKAAEDQKIAEYHFYRKQNDLLDKRVCEGQQFTRIDNQQHTDASGHQQLPSAKGSQRNQTPAGGRSILPEDNLEFEVELDDLQHEEVIEMQPREYQFQKIRDILLSGNEQERIAMPPQERIPPRDEGNVETDNIDHQNRSSSDQKYTKTTSEGQRERATYSPQSERVSNFQQRMRSSEFPQSGQVSNVQQSERISPIQQSERSSEFPQSERSSEFPQSERSSESPQSEKSSESPQSERVSRLQQSEKSNKFPQSERVSRLQQPERSSEFPQSERVSRLQQSEKSSESPQSERVSRLQQPERSNKFSQSERVSRLQQPERSNKFPQSERVSRIQQSLKTDNLFGNNGDISEPETESSNQHNVRTNPQSKRVTIDQRFFRSSRSWLSERTTVDDQERASHVPQSERASYVLQSGRASHVPLSERASYVLQSGRASHVPESGRASHVPQSERASHVLQSGRASHVPESGRASYVPQSERASHVPQSGRASHVPESGRASHVPQSERDNRFLQSMVADDNLFVNSVHIPQSERESRAQQSERVSRAQLSIGADDNIFVKRDDVPKSFQQAVKSIDDNEFINRCDFSQYQKVSCDQQYIRPQRNLQSERVAGGQQFIRTKNSLFENGSDHPQSEPVVPDPCCRGTDDKLFFKRCDSQQFDRTSRDQQNVRASDCPCSRTSDRLYVRPCDNQHIRTSDDQEFIKTRDEHTLPDDTDELQLENGERYQGYKRSQQCGTCSDSQPNTSRKLQNPIEKGNKTDCSASKYKKTIQGQRCPPHTGGILKESSTVWSKVEEAEQEDKLSFDVAMKQMSEYMNSISQACQCYYDSCSKDNLSLLERRHLRMFHKGVLPCKQQPKKKSDTERREETSSSQIRCGSVNKLQREDKLLSERDKTCREDRPQTRGRVLSLGRTPCTDRSQNFIRFPDPGPDLDLENDCLLKDVFHRTDRSHTAAGSHSAKPQFCVRFSDTGAETNHTNKNAHYSEVSDTFSLTNGGQVKDTRGSTSSHRCMRQVMSTESATDNTLNSYSDEAVLENCTSSFDSCQPTPSCVKHQACAQNSEHKGVANTRHSSPSRQKTKPTPGTHLVQGIFIEGMSAFPTKVSQLQSKSSKSKVRSGRISSEQGIFITTKPGSYIVKKPNEDSSIHLLQVNPGKFVKLNM